MLAHKHCHQGLRPRTSFLGLEPLDVLLLFPGLYVCVVFLHRLGVGALVTVVTALAIKVLKWGRLPGYSLALATYLLLAEHHAVLGDDPVPEFPRAGAT